MRKIIASVLVFGLALCITVDTVFTPPALPYEAPMQLVVEFVPQYDPPPPIIRTEVPVPLVRNSPLSINEFERFIAKYRIKVDRFAIRAVTPNNERMTISGKPSTSELVPRDSLALMLTHSSSELQGIIECMGVISARFLKKVNDDARVFLADTSVDNAFMENEFRRHIPSLYWYIEENRST